MNFGKLKSGNCLFLICPTDHIESVLFQSFNGGVYFYTALGVNFSWDIKTQNILVSILEEQEIDEIVFVAKATNRFFRKTLHPNTKVLFPANKTLLNLEHDEYNHFKNQNNSVSKSIILTYHHLQRQEKHLLTTLCLGKNVKQNNIVVKSLVYHPDYKAFYTPLMIERKAAVYGKLSLN